MAFGSLQLWRKVATVLPSSGVQNYRIWKVACSTVAEPFSAGVETSIATPIKADLCDDGASASAEKANVALSKMVKMKIFQKLRSLTVETVDLIIREDKKKGVSITQKDLVSWATRLTNKHRKHQKSLEIFRWMDSKKMIFSPTELALYVDLIAKVKGFEAAENFFNKVDPNFDIKNKKAMNWPAYLKLYSMYSSTDEDSSLDEEVSDEDSSLEEEGSDEDSNMGEEARYVNSRVKRNLFTEREKRLIMIFKATKKRY